MNARLFHLVYLLLGIAVFIETTLSPGLQIFACFASGALTGRAIVDLVLGG